jgi:serine/threonine-protein kinase HipA
VYKRILKWLPDAVQLIDNSFLESDRQKAYKELISERVKVFIQ